MNYNKPLENTDNQRDSDIRLGYSIAKFIREVDTAESNIGKLSEGSTNGPRYLLTTGMQLDMAGNPIHILGDSKTASLDAVDKFKQIRGKRAAAYLKEYIKDSRCNDGEELVQRLVDIEGSKCLILPIKPKMACEILVDEEDLDSRAEKLPDTDSTTRKKGRLKSTSIEIIKWATNKETRKLECFILTDVLDGTSGKRGKISIEEYGKRLFLTDIERSTKSISDEGHKYIEITRHGYIKTIKILNKLGNGIIIDNSFMYSIGVERDTPIAYWNSRNEFVGEEAFHKIEKTTLYKEIKKNINYIAQHRRYIAPNGLSEFTEVLIK